MTKEYHIYEVKKARENQGNCLVCNKEIKVGDSFKRLSWPNPRKIFFCSNCNIDQSLLRKSKIQDSKIPKVEEKDTTVEEINQVEEEISEQVSQETQVTDKAFCSKCNGYHAVGSRRYKQHIAKNEVS